MGVPLGRREAVVERGREAVLGRAAIVHRRHAPAARRAEPAAEAIVGVEVAGHPAAAVEERQRRQRLGAGA